jgi:hypothetical protein
MKMGKKGMELSVNFLITIIISLVIFGFGIKFGYDLIKQGDNMVSGMKQADENKLKGMLDTNAKVSMFEGMVKLKKGNAAIVGVGVLNLLDTSPPPQFNLEVTSDKYYQDEMSGGSSFSEVTTNILVPSTPVSLNQNEKRVFSFSVKADKNAPRGTYTFIVKVKDSPSTVYGDVHQLFVNVN